MYKLIQELIGCSKYKNDSFRHNLGRITFLLGEEQGKCVTVDLELIRQRLPCFDVFNSTLKLGSRHGVMIRSLSNNYILIWWERPRGPLYHVAGETTLSYWKLTKCSSGGFFEFSPAG